MEVTKRWCVRSLRRSAAMRLRSSDVTFERRARSRAAAAAGRAGVCGGAAFEREERTTYCTLRDVYERKVFYLHLWTRSMCAVCL